MMATPDDPSARLLRERGGRLAKGLGAFALVELVGMLLAQSAMAAMMAKAFVSEVTAGRLGIVWSRPTDGALPTTSAIAARALRGASLGLVVAGLCISTSVITKTAAVHPNAPSFALLFTGLVSAASEAVSLELLVHGLVFRVFTDLVPKTALVCLCGLASAAVAIGTSHGPLSGLWSAAWTAGCVGTITGTLWTTDRGAWMPWGTQTAWLWIMHTVIRGGLLDLRTMAPLTTNGGKELERGLTALVVLTATSCLAIVWTHRRSGRPN